MDKLYSEIDELKNKNNVLKVKMKHLKKNSNKK